MPHTQVQNNTKAPEQDILDNLDRVLENLEGRFAISFNLSKLQAANQQDFHIRMALNSIQERTSGLALSVFLCRNNDIICLSEGMPASQLITMSEQIASLFQFDPLVSIENDFIKLYDLKRDFTIFNRHIQNLKSTYDKRDAKHPNIKPPLSIEQKLRPSELKEIEERLSGANLASFIRQQSIYMIVDGIDSRRIYEEIYISIKDLGEAILPDKNLLSNKWLFQSLTETLDKRMIAFLETEKDNLKATYSLNLNIATIITEEFQHLDSTLPADLRKRLIIEFQLLDIFSDIETYRFACQYLKSRGYRICIDGITHHTVALIDRKLLQADLIKVLWSPLLLSDPLMVKDLKHHIERQGIANFILCRCDSQEAIDLGKSLNIAIFQGFFVDQMIRDGVIGPKANQLKRHQDANKR